MKEVKIESEIRINVEAVRSAAESAHTLKDVALQIPVVNPKELTIDSKIYGFQIVPVNDQVKELKNDDARCIAIKEIVVDGLNKTTSPGNITVNGTYDLPLEQGTTVKLAKCYVAKKEDAIEIARVATEVELARAMDALKTAQDTANFLEEQLKNDRF